MTSASLLALGKLTGLFAILVLLLRFKVRLWLTILVSAAVLALFSGIMPQDWPAFGLRVLGGKDFLVLCLMIWLIILLSGVQDATGQNRRLVSGLERYVRSPRLRLVLFPAFIGLLPMPGGALFSCPMIRDAAHGMDLGDDQKALLNYWFRHIWECAWPLYPGYALACALLGVPMTVLWQYTFPLVILSFSFGWFFYLRKLRPDCPPPPEADRDEESLGKVLLNALPIAVTLAGAGLFGFVLNRLAPSLPGQLAFSLSLALAVCTALFQGRGRMNRPVSSLIVNANIRRILLLLAAIFLFKDVIVSSGLVRELGELANGSALVILACILVPFVSGLLTGILVGLVGVAFPIVIGLVQHSPLQEYMLPLAVLALAAGNSGQLLSPLHVCLVVTCEFFNSPMPEIWKKLLAPVACMGAGAVLWVVVLALSGAHF